MGVPFPYGVLFWSMWALPSLRARKGALWFMLMAFSPCLLCSASYVTHCVVITDVTFLMVQLLQPMRLECITKSGKEHWTRSQEKWLSPCLSGGSISPSSFPVLSGPRNWELPSFSGSWWLWFEVLNIKASITVPSWGGRGYLWKLFEGQENCRIATSTTKLCQPRKS